MAKNSKQVGIHLDVGHDSIGWCVTEHDPNANGLGLTIPGTGVVLFPADDCLACERRAFRRQRRNIRSTRQRVARLAALLRNRGVLDEDKLKSNSTFVPWKLAAMSLNGALLDWMQLWAVLRWYAHNRGYDGNVLCSIRGGRVALQDDIEKNEAARKLMTEYGTHSMAETVCRYLEVDPFATSFGIANRFKGLKLSFDRKIVVDEVTKILNAHVGKLNGLDEELVRLIVADPVTEPECLRSRKDLPFRVSARYRGGVLFGQLAPRFDNRIIGKCPISGDKTPTKATPEFLDFRWAMMLMNVRTGIDGRQLTPEEIAMLNEDVAKNGGYTKASFKKTVANVTGEEVNNIDALLTAPDADKSLVRYPGLFAITKMGVAAMICPCDLRKIAHSLFRGKKITLRTLRTFVSTDVQSNFDKLFQPAKQRGKKKNQTFDEILNTAITADIPAGRAPYSREVMKKAVNEAFSGRHPFETGGVLYRDSAKLDAISEDDIDKETNNHLVRHRVKIVLRLVKDIIHDYAENNPARISSVTIEMARDLKDMSGKTNKQIEQEMGLRTAQHRAAAKELAAYMKCSVSKVSAGLIRKWRIAKDLNFTCPYTGVKYDMQDVISKHVDLDHILPRSERASDSLDSLVLTFTEVNRMKGKRTGLDFIRTFQGQSVAGREQVQVMTESRYKEFVDSLKMPGYIEDRRRQKRRQEKLLKLRSDETGMTEGMLTQTSHITTLAQKALRGLFVKSGRVPTMVSVPGRVTAFVRMQWNILGALAQVDPRVLDENNDLRLKSEIRGITHMHHAVDAITIGLASELLPRDGSVWATMCKRRVTSTEGACLKALGCFRLTSENEPRLVDLPDELRSSIREALSEQRVVVHQPQERAGLKVQLNPWGIEREDGDTLCIRQRTRDEATGAVRIKRDKITKAKAFGYAPNGGRGKLKDLKSVLLPSANFGVVLESPPRVVRYNYVWHELSKSCKAQIVRNGDLIKVEKGILQGIWRVSSVKDNASGLALTLVRPYAIKYVSKVDYAKDNVSLSSLISNGLTVVKTRYTGVPLCHTMLSTSPKKESRSQ